MYSGDPHLMRFTVDCLGNTVHFDSQHCSKALTLRFAQSPVWRVMVVQSFAALGKKAPSSIASVAFHGEFGSRVFSRKRVWPKSIKEFNINITARQVLKQRQYDIAASITGINLTAQVERTLWVTKSGQVRQIMSLNLCSASIIRGVARNGCPPHTILSTTPVLSKNHPKRGEHPICASLPNPFRANCNLDVAFASPLAVQAMTAQSHKDAAFIVTPNERLTCQWSFANCSRKVF